MPNFFMDAPRNDGSLRDTSCRTIDRRRRDVLVGGAAVEAHIADSRAAQVLDARGKLVVPGLIDLHAHVYPQGSAIGLPADELVPYTATTTYVSAGDAGTQQLLGLQALRRRAIAAIERAGTNGRVLCHIGDAPGELPARIIGRVDGLGTLGVGAPADVAVLELVEEKVRFVDTKGNAREGTRYLEPAHTVRAGRPFGRPYPSPFGYP